MDERELIPTDSRSTDAKRRRFNRRPQKQKNLAQSRLRL
jgi:hypothetical protein